jgi:iron complex outermembrane receptor protein
MEGRLELVQAKRGGWSGVVGGQFFNRKLSAEGAEAFLPPNSMEQFGLFTLQELAIGSLELEAAARFERSLAEASSIGVERSFDTVSGAVGVSYEIAPLIRFGANLSRAERAPSPEELFSNGPHAATQSFEVGDPDLETERALGGELYFRTQRPRYDVNLSFFYNRFDNFIFQAATGAEEDELPVFGYFQRDAEHWGFEFGANTLLTRMSGYRIVLDGVADYVRATIGEGGGPVPRIPPLRLMAGLEAQSDELDARVEVERSFAQKRIATFENPSAAFTMVNASIAWRPWGRRNPSSIVLSANNIFDVVARRHASFTRDFVPLAGRDIRLSARVSF